MSLLSVVQDVCMAVGVARPTSVFTNLTANRTMQEMLSLANEMAQRIAFDTRDWTMLKAIQVYQASGGTVSADGMTISFPLPTDYKRMMLTSQIWRSTSNIHPMRFVPDLDEWINRRNRKIYDYRGEWTIVGGNLLMVPVLSTGVTAQHAYIVKNCINLSGGGVGDSFQNDADSFRLDERMFKLGMVFQWKANKGQAYQEDLGTFTDALASVMGRDSPAPTIIGRLGVTVAAKTAYPFVPVPTP